MTDHNHTDNALTRPLPHPHLPHLQVPVTLDTPPEEPSPTTQQKRERRRVQWAHETGGDQQEPKESKTEEERLRRELDERGLDRNAFDTLLTALRTSQGASAASDNVPMSPSANNDLLGNNYLPPDQDFGLPAPEPDSESATQSRNWMDRAGDVVGRFWHRRHQKQKPNTPNAKPSRTPSDEKPITIRTESMATNATNDTTPHPNLAGRGVLASLLALYDPLPRGSTQTNSSSASTSHTPSPSGGSTPDSAEPAGGFYFGRMHANHHIRNDSQGPTPASAPAASSQRERLGFTATPATPAPDPMSRMSTRTASFFNQLSLSGASGASPGTPRASVFGPLVAATGNLSGVAAPIASTIGPAVHGTGIARYELGEEGELEEEVLKKPSRPRSWGGISGSREGSPDSPRRSIREGKEKEGLWKEEDTVPELPSDREIKRPNWPGALRDLPHFESPFSWGRKTPGASGASTRSQTPEESDAELDREKEKERERRVRKKKAKRRKEKEIFITMHVAAVLQRQEFLLKLARALMMFGAPSHRLEALIQATARVLDMSVHCVYLPSLMLLSFNDDSTRTSETRFLKQPSALDLGKLQDAYVLYWAVIHDQMSVSDASSALDALMRSRPQYRGLLAIFIGGLCSSFITPISFSGSFIDAVAAFPLGCLLVLIQQLVARNELYAHVFEITVSVLLSFLAAALAGTGKFCYAAVASGSVVLILPGYIVLTGALELASRNIISGSVRMMYALIYSLFLGFGLAIGAEVYTAITGNLVIGSTDSTCLISHPVNGPWYQRPPNPFWAFICVPGFSLSLSLRNQAPFKRKEFFVMILIACAGWTTNHFASMRFVNRSDVTSALGALVVGVTGNLYGWLSLGTAFIVMVTGVLFQVPSAVGTLLPFANATNEGSTDSYAVGFSVAESLIEVSIGLTVGLFVAAAITHPIQSRKRGSGLFSF